MSTLKYRAITVIMIFSFWLLMPTSANAAHQLNYLTEENSSEVLAENLSMFNDSENIFDIKYLIGQPDLFGASTSTNPFYGFVKGALWLKFTVTNNTQLQDWVATINYSQLDKVSAFYVSRNQINNAMAPRSGQIYWPFNKQRLANIPISLKPNESADLYLKIVTPGAPIIAPITITDLDTHNRLASKQQFLWAFFIGSLLTIALFNLANLFIARDNSVIAYVAHLIVFLLCELFIAGHLALWLNTDMIHFGPSFRPFGYIMLALTLSIFAHLFLDLDKLSKTLGRISIRLIVITSFTACLSLLFLHNWYTVNYLLSMVMALITLLMISIYTYVAVKKGVSECLYFAASVSIIVISSIVSLLALNGFVPYTDLTAHSYEIGIFFEVCIISVAFRVRQQKQTTKELHQLTEELEENYTFIEEQSASLDLSRRAAIKANQVKSQFLATMSHEYRTPLNAILGFAGQLKHRDNSPEAQQQLEIIHESADQMRIIVNDLLDYSQIDSGDIQLNHSQFTVDELLEDLIAQLNRDAENKKLEFICVQDYGNDLLAGDKDKIQQVLYHLFRNAIKYTDSGYVYLEISESKNEDDTAHTLSIRVEDSGIGIERAKQEKLFSAVNLLDDTFTRTHQGAGLGLYISNTLVEMMDGSLSVASQPQIGSVFTLALPLQLVEAQEPAKVNATNTEIALANFSMLHQKVMQKTLTELGITIIDVAENHHNQQTHVLWNQSNSTILSVNDINSLSNNFSDCRIIVGCTSQAYIQLINQSLPANVSLVRKPYTKRKIINLLNSDKLQKKHQETPTNMDGLSILAVDDMEMNLRLLETWLEPKGVNITTCLSGKEAINLCQREDYDLILMDIQMPFMDGVSATQHIRQTEKNAGTPIIAVTAHAFEQEKQEFLQSGMDDHLAKPIDLKVLLAVIDSWCDNGEQAVEESVIDWQYALSRTQGDEQLAKQLLQQFLQQLAIEIPQVKAADENDDYAVLASRIHAINGISSQTGATTIKALCQEIEGLLKQQLYQQAKRTLPLLYDNVEKLQKQTVDKE